WDQLFDVGLRGEMGEFGDYFKTWNWELGFRYSRNEGQDLSVGEASQPGLREALLDTDPATAFDPFLNFNAHNTKAARARVYVNLHNSGEYELPIGYLTLNGDLFNLPAGPVSFALGSEYDSPRWTRDRDALNTTFQSIGSTNGESARVNRDVWSIYQEVRVPFTSPTCYFPGTRFIGNPNLQPAVAYEWSYGLVYSPKWIKGLTLSADWWHIDMRSIASLLGTQFTIDLNNPDLVIRGPPVIPGEPGPII